MSDDLSKKRELADDARELLEEHSSFRAAILDLRKRWFDELMTAADSTDQKLELIARMKALEAIPAALAAIMNDYKMAMRREKHAS